MTTQVMIWTDKRVFFDDEAGCIKERNRDREIRENPIMIGFSSGST